MVQIGLVSLQQFQNGGAETEMKLNKERTVKRFIDNTIVITFFTERPERR